MRDTLKNLKYFSDSFVFYVFVDYLDLEEQGKGNPYPATNVVMHSKSLMSTCKVANS